MDTTKKTKLRDYGALSTGRVSVTTWENGPRESLPGCAAKVVIPGGVSTHQHTTRADALLAAARELECYVKQLRAMAAEEVK